MAKDDARVGDEDWNVPIALVLAIVLDPNNFRAKGSLNRGDMQRPLVVA